MYTYGIFITMTVVISHHFTVMINVRNFSTWLVGCGLFSISMLPLTLWLAQIIDKSKTFKSTYRTILAGSNLWLMALVTALFVVMPLYINKRWLQVIKYP